MARINLLETNSDTKLMVSKDLFLDVHSIVSNWRVAVLHWILLTRCVRVAQEFVWVIPHQLVCTV